MTLIVHLIHVFLFGIAAGVWTGVITTGKALRESHNPVVFVEWIQGARKIMQWFMPALLALTSATGLAAVWLPPDRGPASWWIAADLVCLIIAVIVTRTIEVPIVKRAATWTAEAPPADWASQRDRWMQFQGVRTAATVAGFAAALIGFAMR
jgi:uncharacterized membrane protein